MSTALPSLDATCCICTDPFAEDERAIACQACLSRVVDPKDFGGNMHDRCFRAWTRQTCPICDQIISLVSDARTESASDWYGGSYVFSHNPPQPSGDRNMSRIEFLPYSWALEPCDSQPSAGRTGDRNMNRIEFLPYRWGLEPGDSQPS